MMVIDDNYMAMNDSPNKIPAASAPVLATFSQMCPKIPGLAQNSSTKTCQLPAKNPDTAAGTAVRAGETAPTGAETTPQDQTLTAGDTKQLAMQPTTGAAADKPEPEGAVSWTDTIVAIATLGLLTGIAYFGYKAIKH